MMAPAEALTVSVGGQRLATKTYVTTYLIPREGRMARHPPQMRLDPSGGPQS